MKLETERLFLRPIQIEDVATLSTLWTDPEITRFMGGPRNCQELYKSLLEDAHARPQPKFDLWPVIEKTKELLSERKPLFEAGVLADKLYSRVDVLFPVGEDEWDICEVKSSTSIKKVHIDDVAFQRHCCVQYGLSIRNCYLALINNQYVRDGELDPEGLFNIHDVTEKVNESSTDIQGKIDSIIEVKK